jgi:hypothetical protein
MLRRVTLARTDVSEERRFLQEPDGVTSQMTTSYLYPIWMLEASRCENLVYIPNEVNVYKTLWFEMLRCSCYWWKGFMKYTIEMGWGNVMYKFHNHCFMNQDFLISNQKDQVLNIDRNFLQTEKLQWKLELFSVCKISHSCNTAHQNHLKPLKICSTSFGQSENNQCLEFYCIEETAVSIITIVTYTRYVW